MASAPGIWISFEKKSFGERGERRSHAFWDSFREASAPGIWINLEKKSFEENTWGGGRTPSGIPKVVIFIFFKLFRFSCRNTLLGVPPLFLRGVFMSRKLKKLKKI